MTTTDEIRLGVIGVGGRGRLARHAHRPDENTRLVAGADVNPEALAAFKDQYGPEVFVTADYRDLLERADVHAVFITTPDYLHEEQALAALEAGKHVYIEKPMALSIEGADRILLTARRVGRTAFVGHNMRHMPFVIKMKELIDAGAIGEPKVAWCRHFLSYGADAFFKDWHAERRKAVSPLLSKAVHDIDVLHWFCGGRTCRVSGMGALTLYDQVQNRRAPSEPADYRWHESNWPPLAQHGLSPEIDIEDVSHVNLQLDNGVFASYLQCNYTPDGWRNYTIIGTEGRIENLGDYLGDCAVKLWNRRQDRACDADEQWRFPFVSARDHGGADREITAEFVQHVLNGGATRTSSVAARNSVAALCAAVHSIRNGGVPVDVPPPPANV